MEGDRAVFGWFTTINSEVGVDGVEDELFLVLGDGFLFIRFLLYWCYSYVYWHFKFG